MVTSLPAKEKSEEACDSDAADEPEEVEVDAGIDV